MNLLKALLLMAMPMTMVFAETKKELISLDLKPKKPKIEASPDTKTNKLVFVDNGCSTFELKYYNRTEAFYSKNTALLSGSQLDQIFYAQSTNDINLFADIDKSTITSLVSLRNKHRWGNNDVASTTDSSVKLANTVIGSHSHAIGRQVIWIREGWVNLSLSKIFGLQSEGCHYFKFGSFAFDLGRGISLGSAYGISPGSLGFFSNNIIDQYANAILFGGDIVKDQLAYSVYASMLENPSDRLISNMLPVFAQEIGRRTRPWRGFGQINSLFATKLTWTIKNPACCLGALTVEPYAMINKAPEQKVDFDADAKSKLGTIGLSCEYKGSAVEWGFDVAANFGHQTVRPWDRNQLDISSLEGVLTEIYSDVYSDAAKTTNAIITKENKAIVDSSNQTVAENGKLIGVGSSDLYNSDSRFRSGYTNKYKGMMFVTDIGAWVYKKELKLAGTFAFATGDDNPNKDLSDPLSSSVDGDFTGFIGLQEIYSGKQVKSVMVLGAAAIPRPMSSPFNTTVPRRNRFASRTSGFTNLVFFGIGAEWAPECWRVKFRVKPNLLAFWQEKATNKFDAKTKLSIDQKANKFLGIEANCLFTVYLHKHLNGFITAGVFAPGAHFKDVQGRPLSAALLKALEDRDKTGFTGEVAPVLGTKPAFMLNWGLEYNF